MGSALLRYSTFNQSNYPNAMGLLLISNWIEQKVEGSPLVTLDDDSSAYFELRVAVNIKAAPTERWLTCIIREKSAYTLPDGVDLRETERDLLSGGGGLGVSIARSSGALSQMFVPITRECICEMSESDFSFRSQDAIGKVPVFDCSPWHGEGKNLSATRAFRAPIRSTFLKAQRGLMFQWGERDESDISWYSIEEKILIAVENSNELVGFAFIDLSSTMLEKALLINSGR